MKGYGFFSLILSFFAIVFMTGAAWAKDSTLETDFSGRLRAQGYGSKYDKPHVLDLVDRAGPLADGGLDARLNGSLFLGSLLTLEAQYEAVASGGQTRKAFHKLSGIHPMALTMISEPPSDEKMLFSLTNIIADEKEYLSYHRLDRLNAALTTDQVTVKAGRQALTWGNGLVFNPMDLLNPFAPSDVIRDYKNGDDMLTVQGFFGPFSDIALAWTPRRNSETGDVSGSDSSVAAKIKFTAMDADWDVMGARHYEDSILGAGMVKYVGDAAWRLDLTFTARKGDFSDGFVSGVTNLDYSWVWADHNFYGLMELYYNGAGERQVVEAAADPDLAARIDRGDVFVMGRWHAAGQIRLEVHPLVNLYFSPIINLDDWSMLLQPRISWDALSSLQVLAGMDIPAGAPRTEYGGLDDPLTGKSMGGPARAYMICTWYF